jgi:carboxypeptidase D
MKAYFRMAKPPVNLAKVLIGDGTIGNYASFIQAPVSTVIETVPQLIGYDPKVFEYFQTQFVILPLVRVKS